MRLARIDPRLEAWVARMSTNEGSCDSSHLLNTKSVVSSSSSSSSSSSASESLAKAPQIRASVKVTIERFVVTIRGRRWSRYVTSKASTSTPGRSRARQAHFQPSGVGQEEEEEEEE